MPLQDIVNVIIEIQATTPQRVAFGVPLIVGTNAPWGATQRIKSFSTYEAVIDPADGGFNDTDPEAIMARLMFSQNPAPKTVKIGFRAAGDGSWTNTLNLLRNTDPNWYGLVTEAHGSSDVQAIAGWMESQMGIYIVSSQDANIINQAPGVDTSSIAYLLKNAGYTRSAVLYHHQADSLFPEAAFLARGIVADPGTITWAFKDLAGVPVSPLTASQESNALGKNANIFLEIAGVRITRNGTSAQGLFLDLVQARDWIKDTIQKRVYGLLTRLPKLPYDDKGIEAVANEIRSVLKTAQGLGIVADDPPFAVEVPKALDVDPGDRAARILRNVKFSARLSGAIHSIEIKGVLTI
jgi:hypothetical protein